MTPQEQQAFDAMREALEVLNNLDADINFLNTNELEEMMEKALSAAKAVRPQAQGEAVLKIRTWTKPSRFTGDMEGHGEIVEWMEGCSALEDGEHCLYTHPQASEPEKSLHELLRMGAEENEQLKAQLAGMEKLLRFKEAMDASEPEVWVVENKVMQMHFWSEAEARKAAPNTATAGIHVRRLHVFGSAPEATK